MREVLVAFAEYNKAANGAMAAILAGLDEGLLAEDQGVYYKSLRGTVEHIIKAELTWLRRWRDLLGEPVLTSSALLKTDAADIDRRMAGSKEGLLSLLAEADALYLEFVKGLVDARLSDSLRYKNIHGEELERPYWKTVFHVLNHSTHHRGEISALLDRRGVKNDFSGFTLYSR